MHLLWISDSPDTPSGFGNVTRFVCEGLARRGHKVSILGWQTLEQHEWHGCTVYPNGRLPLGSDAFLRALLRLRPEIVIALGDVWWLPYFSAPHIRQQMELLDTPWALYFPVDGDMEGERLPASWVELLRDVDVPISMSRYGQRIARQAGVSCYYIPHGVDLNVFRPPADRAAAKACVGAADKFLILADNRNQPRKMIPRLLDVFAGFAAGRPDALLHLHTDPDDEFARSATYSYDVRADIQHLGLEAQVRFTPGMAMKRGGGLPLEQLAAYYQAADVHLLASSGEGFGLPTLQAAAAGAVPMAGAYSASLELVEGHGEAIRIGEWTENEFGIRRGLIDVADAGMKLVRFYDDRDLLRARSAKCCEFAAPYGWEEVVKQWDTLLRSIVASRGSRVKRPRSASAPQRRVREMVPSLRSLPQGIRVDIKVAERTYGRLEAAIVSDVRGRSSDVNIPTLPEPSVTAGLRVLRRSGYVAVGEGDIEIFERLRRIFPALQAWSSAPTVAWRQDDPGSCVRRLSFPVLHEASLEVAQSILLLNVGGALPAGVLQDAALFGVPCVGAGSDPVQCAIWPELAADSPDEAVRIARAVLTNAALAKRVALAAGAKWRKSHAVDEMGIAQNLRNLFTAQCDSAQFGLQMAR